MAEVKIEEGWKEVLGEEFEKNYFNELTAFVREEYKKNKVYPPAKQIFRAFDECPFEKVKVVILGQDPYHGPNQANGLCFSVNKGVAFPPSLQNIFKELSASMQLPYPSHGDLGKWAKQGVFLLNSSLTVREGLANSHAVSGWAQFTDAVIQALSKHKTGLVYFLWGSFAQKKAEFVDGSKNLVLKAPHPSPLSAHRGFLGCGHFVECNKYLQMNGIEGIDWEIG